MDILEFMFQPLDKQIEEINKGPVLSEEDYIKLNQEITKGFEALHDQTRLNNLS